jgi:integrase
MRPGTAKNVRYILNKFVEDTGVGYAAEITSDRLSRWVEDQKTAGRAQETLVTYSAAVATFVKWMHKNRVIRFNSLEGFDLPERANRGRQSWLRTETVDKVLEAAEDPNLKFILFCGFHAGMRRAEISAARVNWFDTEHGLVHVQNDPDAGFILKDRDNRTIPMTKDFEAFLKNYLDGRESHEYVLAPDKAKGIWKYRYDFLKVIQKHFGRCGVDCTIHDMRRSFASNLVSHGVSVYKVARWLGDRVDVVEESYGHLAPKDDDINRL